MLNEVWYFVNILLLFLCFLMYQLLHFPWLSTGELLWWLDQRKPPWRLSDVWVENLHVFITWGQRTQSTSAAAGRSRRWRTANIWRCFHHQKWITSSCRTIMTGTWLKLYKSFLVGPRLFAALWADSFLHSNEGNTQTTFTRNARTV